MNKYLYTVILMQLIITFSSCEKEISPNFKNGERKIVLNSIINPDSIFSVYLSESIFAGETFFGSAGLTGSYKVIENAKIEIFDDDGSMGNMQYNGGGIYSSDFFPEINKNYSLKVLANNFPQAQTKTKLPIKTLLDSVKIISENEDDFYNLGVSLYFNDLSGINNYYYLVVLYNNTKFDIFNFGGKNIFKSNDPVFLKHIDQKQYYIFNDDFFDGKSYGLNIQLTPKIYDGTNTDTIYYHFYFCSINHDFYSYLESYNNFVLTTDPDHNPLPLSEPVEFYKNVEDGFGIFGGYQIDIDTLIYVKPVVF